MRGIEDAGEHGIGDRVGQKLPAHIAAIENAFVDGVALGGRKFGIGLDIAGWHRLLFLARGMQAP